MSACIHNLNVYIDTANMHTHTCMHAYIHTYIDTYLCVSYTWACGL